MNRGSVANTMETTSHDRDSAEAEKQATPLTRRSDFMRCAASAAKAFGTKPLSVGIDEKALIENVRHIKQRLGSRRLCAVLKGDAYGHGIALVADLLRAHCSRFAVADNSEAIKVRRRCPEASIMRLRSGTSAEIEEALIKNLCIREAVGTSEKVAEIASACRRHGAHGGLHVSLDAGGLGRGGMSIHDAQELIKEFRTILSRPEVTVQSLGCHLPDAGASIPHLQADATRLALQRFIHLAKILAIECTNANRPVPEISAFSSVSSVAFGAENTLESLGFTVFDRIGNGLFGLASSISHRESPSRQVMHVATSVIDRLSRPRGATIGYERTYTVTEQIEHIALLGFGWLGAGRTYQGIGKTSTPAWVLDERGRRHDLIGRQSMNVTTVRCMDDLGTSLTPGQTVFVLTDGGLHEWRQRPPTVEAISHAMGGVQPEYVTSVFGLNPSANRFIF